MEYQPSTILPPIDGSTKFGGTQSRIIMGGVNCQNVGTQYIPCIEIAGETTAQYGLKIAGSVVSRVTTPNTSVYTIGNAYSFLNDNALPTGTVVATGVTGDPITYDTATGVLTGVTTEAFVAGTAYWCKEIITIADGITLYLYTPTTAGRDIKEVYDKVETITSVAGDLNAAKAELAAAISSKGVTTSATATLMQMAENVSLIERTQSILDANGMYCKELYGSENVDNSPLWNLYDVLVNMKNRFLEQYGGLLVCEYYKGYDTLQLEGADAYYTCDGALYDYEALHTWNDLNNGRLNRWVCFLYRQAGANVNITNTAISPRSMYIGGHIGIVTYFVDGRLFEIKSISDEDYIDDLVITNNTTWNRSLVLSGIKYHNTAQKPIIRNASVDFLIMPDLIETQAVAYNLSCYFSADKLKILRVNGAGDYMGICRNYLSSQEIFSLPSL